MLAEPAVEALRRALDAEDIGATLRAAQLILDRTGFHPTKNLTGDGAGGPVEFTLNLDPPVTRVEFVGPTERYMRWIPEERIALMRAWFREGMLAEQEKKPPLHADFEPLLSTEE